MTKRTIRLPVELNDNELDSVFGGRLANNGQSATLVEATAEVDISRAKIATVVDTLVGVITQVANDITVDTKPPNITVNA